MITAPGKDLIQNWEWRNKKLFRQAKVTGIQYHKTSFIANVKGTYITKKYSRRKNIYNINPKQLRKLQYDRSSKQKINKETQGLKCYIRWDGSHWYLQDSPSKSRRTHLLLKCTWIMLQIDHILGHKSNLSKFKKIEIISSIFSDHNAIRLDINYKKKL